MSLFFYNCGMQAVSFVPENCIIAFFRQRIYSIVYRKGRDREYYLWNSGDCTKLTYYDDLFAEK